MKLDYTSCTKIESQAEKLGIYKLPQLTLYTQPRYISQRYRSMWSGFWSNCLIDATEQFLRTLDPETQMCYTLIRNKTFLLAPNLPVLMKFQTRQMGWGAFYPSNHTVRIDFWAEADFTEQIIERLIWAQNGDPIGEGINWDKIEQAWEIQRQEAIKQWRRYLPLK